MGPARLVAPDLTTRGPAVRSSNLGTPSPLRDYELLLFSYVSHLGSLYMSDP